jgi:hypothetical protein
LQRQAIKLEIQRKQEELREENRKRKEQRRSQPIPIEDVSPSTSVPSSPMRGDGFSTSFPTKSRVKRKSWSAGRRRRSNSEGSDSSFSDSSELVLLEFPYGKSTTLFYRGQVVGKLTEDFVCN